MIAIAKESLAPVHFETLKQAHRADARAEVRGLYVKRMQVRKCLLPVPTAC
jgi:hypothetical protein